MAAPASKEAPAVGLLLGLGKGGGKPKPSAPAELGAAAPSKETSGAFDVAAEEFLDDTLPMEERKAALKRAVMACMDTEY